MQVLGNSRKTGEDPENQLEREPKKKQRTEAEDHYEEMDTTVIAKEGSSSSYADKAKTPGKTQGSNPTAPKAPRIPPIFVDVIDEFTKHARELKRVLQKNVEIRASGKGARIYAESPTEFRHVQDYLRKLKIEFHTFPLPSEREVKVAIKGLANSITADELQFELTDQGYAVTYVTKITGRNKGYSNIFLVCLKNLPYTRNIYNINKLLYCSRVRVAAFKSRAVIPQCYHCQRFGHSSLNCGYQPRCVRCGKNHYAAECEKQRETPPTCANCSGAHPANYRKCGVYQELLKQKKGKQQRAALEEEKPQDSTSSSEESGSEIKDNDWETQGRRRKRRRRKRGREQKNKNSADKTTTTSAAGVATPDKQGNPATTTAGPLAVTASYAGVAGAANPAHQGSHTSTSTNGATTSGVRSGKSQKSSRQAKDEPAVINLLGFNIHLGKIPKWIALIAETYKAGNSIVPLLIAAIGDILVPYNG